VLCLLLKILERAATDDELLNFGCSFVNPKRCEPGIAGQGSLIRKSDVGRFARRVAGVALRGHGVQCACCGGRFRRFLSFGNPRRKNALCPACGSLERHRFLWLYLERSGKLDKKSLSLLHIAPERAIARQLDRRKNVKQISLDLLDDSASVRGDAEALPFRDNAFDGLICFHVLEHVSDDAAALREIRRALSPDGWAVISVPYDQSRPRTDEDPTVTDTRERRRRFGQEDHVRRYGRDFLQRLDDAGLRFQQRQAKAVIPANLLAVNAIGENEIFVECNKNPV